MRLCDEVGCGRQHVARGFCAKHYQAARGGGMGLVDRPSHHTLTDVDPDAMKATCQVCGPDAELKKVKGSLVCRTKLDEDRRKRRKAESKTEKYLSYHRIYRRRRMIGASSNDQVESVLQAVGHRCEICERELTWTTARFDHDHDCCPGGTPTPCGGCFRGVLCQSCNTGIGMFSDDVARLGQAQVYLRRAGKTLTSVAH